MFPLALQHRSTPQTNRKNAFHPAVAHSILAKILKLQVYLRHMHSTPSPQFGVGLQAATVTTDSGIGTTSVGSTSMLAVTLGYIPTHH